MAKTETIWATYTFTDEEAKGNAKALAQKLTDKESLEAQLVSVKSQFKSDIDMKVSEINDLRNKVSYGHEERQFRCEVKLNVATKEREYYDLNTGELIKVEPFKNEDYQKDMFEEEEVK